MDVTQEARQVWDKTLREALDYEIGRARAGRKKATGEFLDRFDLNPADAIEWSAEAVVKAQAVHEIWMRVELALSAGRDAQAVVREALEDVQDRIRSFFGSNSTSVFHNAESRARAEAYLRAGDDLTSIARHFGI